MNEAGGSEFTINFGIGALKAFCTKILFVFCAVKRCLLVWMILTKSHMLEVPACYLIAGLIRQMHFR
jgi:hypothetical protein